MPSQEEELRACKARSESKGTALGAASSEFDRDLYGGAKGLSREIVDEPSKMIMKGRPAPVDAAGLEGPADEDDGRTRSRPTETGTRNIPIAERESAYQAKGRATRELSPSARTRSPTRRPLEGSEAMGSNVWIGSATIY